MGNNHEIRFECSREEKEIADKLYSLTSPDLKKSAFNKRVFLWGLTQLKNRALKDNNILLDIIK